MRWFIGTLCLAAFAVVASAAEKGANVLYDALTTDGVKLSDGTVIAVAVILAGRPCQPRASAANAQRSGW